MRKVKLFSFLVLSLVLLVSLPALTLGQTAPDSGGGKGTGGKPTPVPTSTPTPVIGDDDGDEDGDAEGCLGALYFLYDFGGCHHLDFHRFGDGGRFVRH